MNRWIKARLLATASKGTMLIQSLEDVIKEADEREAEQVQQDEAHTISSGRRKKHHKR
jgi:hypothetical protein